MYLVTPDDKPALKCVGCAYSRREETTLLRWVNF